MPPSDVHDLIGSSAEFTRGWRVEPGHVGEWLPVPAPGKITIIDFWSTSCQPCIESMPDLEEIWRESDRERVQVVGVAIDDEPVPVQRVLASLGVSFPMLIDSAGALSKAYLVAGKVPATFVVDAEGDVVLFVAGGDDHMGRVEESVKVLLSK